jgi:hypothetical protein
MSATRLTAQEFIDKIKTSENWTVVESPDRDEIELLVVNETIEPERYLGPDPMVTKEDDLMAFLYYLEELVSAYNAAAAAENGDIPEEGGNE